jgi:hypothetical protein
MTELFLCRHRKMSSSNDTRTQTSERLPGAVKKWVYEHSVTTVNEASQLGFDKQAPGKFYFADRGELFDQVIVKGYGRWGFRDNKTRYWHPAIDIDCKVKEGQDTSTHR